MIKHKEKNKYSLNAESYGISKVRWKQIKYSVMSIGIDNEHAIKSFRLDETEVDGNIVIDEDLCKKRVWFLYDILLQEKYNHLYKRDKLVEPKVGDYVYCDYDGFGRGTVDSFSLDGSIMVVKFDKRALNTFCDVSSMSTNFDEVKRKVTRL